MYQKLLTKELEADFARVGDQDIEDPIVIVKFFYPAGCATWLATSYDPETRQFFGYVSLHNDHCNELGYFSLDELQNFKGQFGLGIERDMHFKQKPLSETKKEEGIC